MLGPNDGAVKLLAPDGFAQQSTIDQAGPASRRDVRRACPARRRAALTGAGSAFVKELKAQVGDEPVEVFAPYAGQAAEVLLDAIQAGEDPRRHDPRASSRRTQGRDHRQLHDHARAAIRPRPRSASAGGRTFDARRRRSARRRSSSPPPAADACVGSRTLTALSSAWIGAALCTTSNAEPGIDLSWSRFSSGQRRSEVPGDVPVRAVVGDDQAVLLQRHGDRAAGPVIPEMS